MATAALAGYKGVMLASSSDGGSPTKILELQDYTISVEHAEIDATSHDSSGSREVIGGIDSWTVTADILQVTTDVSHQNAFDRTVGKEKVDFEFYPTGSSSDGFYSGSGFFSGFEMGAPNEDALNASLSAVGTGTLTRSSSST